MSEIKEHGTTQEIVKDGICQMCHDSCRTKIHIREGRAVKIDMVDQSSVATCPRWKAQLDFVYHPDRLKYPLKRVGDRGTGSFVRISWDEALDTVASKFQEIKAKYGAESVVFWISYAKDPRPCLHRLTLYFSYHSFNAVLDSSPLIAS